MKLHLLIIVLLIGNLSGTAVLMLMVNSTTSDKQSVINRGDVAIDDSPERVRKILDSGNCVVMVADYHDDDNVNLFEMEDCLGNVTIND